MVSAILSKPDQPTTRAVLLCHGFLSQKNSKTNQRLTELLIPQGIATFRFDWFGMGESEGTFSNITIEICCQQLDNAMAYLGKQGYTGMGIVGSSFGGLISILKGGSYSSLRTIGLKCPVPNLPKLFRTQLGEGDMAVWQRTNQIPNSMEKGTMLDLEFSFYETSCQYNAFSAAEQIHIPTCIVHGEADELVPISQVRQLARSFKGENELHVLPGADHHFSRPEDFREMTSLLATWITERLSCDS